MRAAAEVLAAQWADDRLTVATPSEVDLARWLLDATATDAGIRTRIWTTTGQDDQTVAALAECHYRLPLAAARAITQGVA